MPPMIERDQDPVGGWRRLDRLLGRFVTESSGQTIYVRRQALQDVLDIWDLFQELNIPRVTAYRLPGMSEGKYDFLDKVVHSGFLQVRPWLLSGLTD